MNFLNFDSTDDVDKLNAELGESLAQLILQFKLSVDIQSVLRLLVSKEIITKEEMDNMRNIVSNQDPYSTMKQKIEELQELCTESLKANEIIKKFIKDSDSLTKEENEYLDKLMKLSEGDESE